jgi:hypothetical protein
LLEGFWIAAGLGTLPDMNKRMMITAGASAVLAATAVLAAATPASATSRYGCTYPRVCFYLTEDDYFGDSPTAAFQDVTSGWQTLGSRSRGSKWIVNTRNDDVAYLHFTDGATACLLPNFDRYNGSHVVDKIRISSSSTC